MVFDYAKEFVGTVKDKTKNIKNMFGLGERDDLSEINDRAESISKYERKIDQDLSEINRRFQSKRERAEQKISEVEPHPDLEQIRIHDNTVKIGGENSFYERLFGDGVDTIQLESQNLLNYVDELNREIGIRREELDQCVDSMERMESSLVGEMFDIESELDDYSEDILKSLRADTIFSERVEKLEDEIDALQREMVSTVDNYTEKFYDEAVELAEDLGGMERSTEGEFDILRSLADSRSSVLGRSKLSNLYSNSSVMDESQKALESQYGLVNEYIEELNSYSQDINTLYQKANTSIDEQRLKPIEDRLYAIEEGIEGLSDVVDGHEYPSLEDALKETLGKGMGLNDEELYSEPRPKAGGL